MDHSVVNIQRSSISCGVVELSRMDDSDMDKVLFAIANNFYHPARGYPPAFAIWSNVAGKENSGHALVRKIDEFKLGEIEETEGAINPSTGNYIRVWVWNIDHEIFKAYYVKQRVERAKKV